MRLGEDTRITVGRAEQHEDDGAARHGRARDVGVHQGGAGSQLNGRVETEQFLHGRRQRLLRGAGGREPGQLVGVSEEGVHAVADQADGRLVPGGHELRAGRHGLRPGRPVVGVVSEHAQNPRGFRAPQGDADVPRQPDPCPRDALARAGGDQTGRIHAAHQERGGLREAVAKVFRHPDQIRDHPGGQRPRDIRDDIRRARPRRRLDEAGRHVVDPAPQRQHLTRRERAPHALALARVAGRIGQQERAGGHAVTSPVLCRLGSVTEARIAQDGLRLDVPEDHDVTRRRAVHRTARPAHLLVEAVRILHEFVGAGVERELSHQTVGQRIGCFHSDLARDSSVPDSDKECT